MRIWFAAGRSQTFLVSASSDCLSSVQHRDSSTVSHCRQVESQPQSGLGAPWRPHMRLSLEAQGALQQGTCSRAASASRASCAARLAETAPLPQRSRAATLPCASWSLPWSSSRASCSWRRCPAAAATSAARRSLAVRLAASCSCNAASVVLRSSSACSRRNSAVGRDCVRLHHQQGPPLRVTSQPCMDCPPGFLVYDKL